MNWKPSAIGKNNTQIIFYPIAKRLVEFIPPRWCESENKAMFVSGDVVEQESTDK